MPNTRLNLSQLEGGEGQKKIVLSLHRLGPGKGYSAGHGRPRAVCGFSAGLTAVGPGIIIGLDGDDDWVCLHQELKWEIPGKSVTRG